MDAAKGKLLRVAAIISVFALFIYSSLSSTPIIIANPPITRRANPYLIPYPSKPKCGTLLNKGSWTDEPVALLDECDESIPYASCNLEALRRWEWAPEAQKCGIQYLSTPAAQKLLAGRWVACVGDSIARNLCSSIMRVLGAPPTAFNFERHGDFEQTIGGDGEAIKVTFHWRPYPQNASEAITAWRHDKKPALIVTSTTLWHMLHIQNAEAFEKEVAALAAATTDMIPKLESVPKPVVVMSTGTEVHTERLLSAEKRVAMTPAAADAYNKALVNGGALAPKGPFGMLDMFSLTYGRGGILKAWNIDSLEEQKEHHGYDYELCQDRDSEDEDGGLKAEDGGLKAEDGTPLLDLMEGCEMDESAMEQVEITKGAEKHESYTLSHVSGEIMHLVPLAAAYDKPGLVASASEDSCVYIHDWQTQQLTALFAGHEDNITSLSTDAGLPSWVLSSSYDGTSRLWDVRQQGSKEILTLDNNDTRAAMSAVLVSDGGGAYAFTSCDTQSILCWDLRTQKFLYELSTGNTDIVDMSWDASTRCLVCSTDCPYIDRMGSRYDYGVIQGYRWPKCFHKPRDFLRVFDAGHSIVLCSKFTETPDLSMLPIGVEERDDDDDYYDESDEYEEEMDDDEEAREKRKEKRFKTWHAIEDYW